MSNPRHCDPAQPDLPGLPACGGCGHCALCLQLPLIDPTSWDEDASGYWWDHHDPRELEE